MNSLSNNNKMVNRKRNFASSHQLLFQTEANLTLKSRNSFNNYACTLCPVILKTQAKLTSHLKTEHKETKIPNAGKSEFRDELPEKIKLSKDKIKKKKLSIELKCRLCNATFITQSGLKLHMRSHNGAKPFVCNECGASFSQSCHLLIHKRTHTGETPYQCSLCKQAFKQISHLRSHERIHSQTKPFSCDQCGRSFIQKSSLNRHFKIHSSERPFSCYLCSLNFKLKDNLNRHIVAKHTNYRPFKCEICGAKFIRLTCLKRHYISHNGIKNFKCEECLVTFSRSSSLNDHLFKHIGETPFECDKCSAKFNDPKSLRKHCRIIHEKSRSSCLECPKEFFRSKSLKNHRKNHPSKIRVSGEIGPTIIANARLEEHMITHTNKNECDNDILKHDAKTQFSEISETPHLESECEQLKSNVEVNNNSINFKQNITDSYNEGCQAQYMPQTNPPSTFEVLEPNEYRCNLTDMSTNYLCVCSPFDRLL